MTELFEEIILVGGYDPNKFVARIDELKELGWFVDHTIKVEFADDDIRIRVAKLKRSIYQKANHELPESPLTEMVMNITKAEWEKALEGRRTMGWQSRPVFLTRNEPVSIYKVVNDHFQYENLVYSIIAVSNLDQQQFLKDFETWYQLLNAARSRMDCLEYIYTELVMGHGLPWEKAV